MADSLPERILGLQSLQRELHALTLHSATRQFPKIESVPRATISSLNYLLECASVLAHSTIGACQDAALRIAQYCLTDVSSTDTQRDAAAVILDSMTNMPAVALAIERAHLRPDYIGRLPTMLRLDCYRRAVRFARAMRAGDSIRLNAFQVQVYDSIQASDWTSLSAPTSSGKSFILLRILEELVLEGRARNVVVVVPTRALIQQLENDLRTTFSEQLRSSVRISSVPRLQDGWDSVTNVFVFTQERLHWLLTDAPRHFAIDTIFVDEAQKIGDGARGILLDEVLGRIAAHGVTRYVFASPMTSNPDVLLWGAPKDARTATVSSEQVAVNQNLIWVTQVPRRPREWSAHLCLGETMADMGVLKLAHTPTQTQRLPMVAHALSPGQGGNLVYANGPAAAERAAQILASLESARNLAPDTELQSLSTLTQRVVHPKYLLASVLMQGVAFHYGNMPLLIRSEIERLFKAGKIRFLVCTPTLIEGVNLPARSIFMRGPEKGVGNPMSDIDFWNLAGRAGRQGMEFQGNVVCVDATDKRVWKSPPPTRRARYKIIRSLDEIVGARDAELLAYVQNGTPRGTDRTTQELEYAFVFFLQEHAAYGGLAASPLASRYAPSFIEAMRKHCDEVLARTQIPLDVIRRNPGVSPLAMQSLLDYLRRRPDLLELIPISVHSDDSYEHYKHTISLLSKYLSGDPDSLAASRAVLVTSWLKGLPLSRIILNTWTYWEGRRNEGKQGKALAAVIRDTMAEVEEYIRFRFAKYCGCYVDLLQLALRLNGIPIPEPMPDLRFAIEFGASSRTQLSLMGIGLSRTTAIMLSEVIADDELDEPRARVAVGALNLEGLGFSPIMIAEILRLIPS